MNDVNTSPREEKVLVSREFDPAVARQISTDAAIILRNIEFWVGKEAANKNEKKFIDGRYWTYNSAKAFAAMFTWMHPRKIGRHLTQLEEAGYIISGNHNRHKYDRTKWFTLGDSPICQKCQMDSTQMTNANDISVEPIPNNKPDKTQLSTYSGNKFPEQSENKTTLSSNQENSTFLSLGDKQSDGGSQSGTDKPDLNKRLLTLQKRLDYFMDVYDKILLKQHRQMREIEVVNVLPQLETVTPAHVIVYLSENFKPFEKNGKMVTPNHDIKHLLNATIFRNIDERIRCDETLSERSLEIMSAVGVDLTTTWDELSL